MSAILGISAFFHDSAAALVVDGEIVAAAQEERFSRIKHDASFPKQAVEYCLAEAGLAPGALDYVGFYDKPLLKLDRLLMTYLSFAPRGLRSFSQAIPRWIQEKLHLPRALDAGLNGEFKKRFIFAEHHVSHAASAFYPSPFDEAAILTVDGVGEWATSAFGMGRGNAIELTHELRFPHSLGLLYSAFTYYCGFKVNSGEYKLMGLAPYGEPRYAQTIREELVELRPDGSFRLDLDSFDFPHGLRMTSRRFHALFDGPPRRPESELTQRHKDLAASIQLVTEDILLHMGRHVHAQTGMKSLCMAGGVALNCVANARLLREGPFESIWVQPAAGDAGGALGVALHIWHDLMGRDRVPTSRDRQRGSLLGPGVSRAPGPPPANGPGGGRLRGPPPGAPRTNGHHAPHQPPSPKGGSLPWTQPLTVENGPVTAVAHRVEDESELLERVVIWIEKGLVVGWFDGRMEYGPRALGNRSILGDPRREDMQRAMNLKIKFRESFRPFAPVVLAERADEVFEMGRLTESPYMLFTAQVRPEWKLPAVTHVDGSARVQTVDEARHGRFHRLLRAFAARTDCPVLVNTSFNVRGEPIVCTPTDAYDCFMATEMDALVIGDRLLLKSEQPESNTIERQQHLNRFEPD